MLLHALNIRLIGPKSDRRSKMTDIVDDKGTEAAKTKGTKRPEETSGTAETLAQEQPASRASYATQGTSTSRSRLAATGDVLRHRRAIVLVTVVGTGFAAIGIRRKSRRYLSDK